MSWCHCKITLSKLLMPRPRPLGPGWVAKAWQVLYVWRQEECLRTPLVCMYIVHMHVHTLYMKTRRKPTFTSGMQVHMYVYTNEHVVNKIFEIVLWKILWNILWGVKDKSSSPKIQLFSLLANDLFSANFIQLFFHTEDGFYFQNVILIMFSKKHIL